MTVSRDLCFGPETVFTLSGAISARKPKSLERFKDTLRNKTRRTQGQSLEMVIAGINPVIQGEGGARLNPSSLPLPMRTFALLHPEPLLILAAMQVVTSTVRMQQMTRQWRGTAKPVVLVPTMGALHEGHLSLIRRARKIAGKRGRVVVSIYVNPTQFGPHEDMAAYPRDFARDKKLCAQCGADVVLAPGDKEMYPEGFSTYVVEESLSRWMEGQSRPTHFRGVTTVVAKLFHLVQPDAAVFGAKDFQQVAVIKRMVRDLNLPVKIVVAPICRERDGLAMSSRNQYLTPEERAQAAALWEALQEARRLVKERGSIPSRAMRDRLKRQIEQRPAARVDYVELFDPEILQPVARAEKGVQIALAVFIGRTRLIDNARL